MRFSVIILLATLCVILAATIIRKDLVIAKSIDTGIFTHKGKNYHVIPWEGTTP